MEDSGGIQPFLFLLVDQHERLSEHHGVAYCAAFSSSNTISARFPNIDRLSLCRRALIIDTQWCFRDHFGGDSIIHRQPKRMLRIDRAHIRLQMKSSGCCSIILKRPRSPSIASAYLLSLLFQCSHRRCSICALCLTHLISFVEILTWPRADHDDWKLDVKRS
ncbi:hypothetical protein ABKN59_005495 [Abortiporus biennis]